VVAVVREPHADAAVRRIGERAHDRRHERLGEPQVVDRDLERALRGPDPVGERLRRLLRRLSAVGERADVYLAAFARSSALCARFAAW
jgi:hypothetical protein